VVQNDNRFYFRILLVELSHPSGQEKAGGMIGNNPHPRSKSLSDKIVCPLLVCQNEDGIGMSVINVTVGKKGMKKRLHRRTRRLSGYLMDEQLVLHLFVMKVSKTSEFPKAT
jgi:hypothetical protein